MLHDVSNWQHRQINIAPFCRCATVPTTQQEAQCITATYLIVIIPGALTGRQTLSSSVVKHTEWINTQARTDWEILFLRSAVRHAAGSNQEQLVLALDRRFTTRCDVIRGRSLSRNHEGGVLFTSSKQWRLQDDLLLREGDVLRSR